MVRSKYLAVQFRPFHRHMAVKQGRSWDGKLFSFFSLPSSLANLQLGTEVAVCMSFFAARRPVKGNSTKTPSSATTTATNPATTNGTSTTLKNGVSNAAAATTASINKSSSVTSSATPSSTTTTTKLVSVTRKVVASAVPQTLKERQALARAKRAKELEREAQDEKRRLAIDSEQRAARAKEEAAKRRKLDKGKSKAVAIESRATNGRTSVASKRSRSDSTSSDAATPARKSKARVDSSSDDGGEGSSRFGTPIFERKQPLKVTRDNVAAPKDDLESIEVISGEKHVRRSMNDFVPCEAHSVSTPSGLYDRFLTRFVHFTGRFPRYASRDSGALRIPR